MHMCSRTVYIYMYNVYLYIHKPHIISQILLLINLHSPTIICLIIITYAQIISNSIPWYTLIILLKYLKHKIVSSCSNNTATTYTFM